MSNPIFEDLMVIDCASFIAAPAAAAIFADFGARVIKLEPPGLGDGYRLFERLPGLPKGDKNYPWRMVSRSKESLALDLKASRGRDAFERLVKKADVFITNFPLPVRDALKLGAEEIRALNPRIIYASFTPYGERGDEAPLTGYDATAWWARSGLMDLVRATPDTTPAISMPGMGDFMSGNSLYGAIVTALYRRERTGEGAEVGSSLMANGLWSNGVFVQAALDGADVSVSFNTGKTNAFARTLRCRDDRWFVLAILPQVQDKVWPAFARTLGHPEWTEDPRFVTAEDRKENNDALCALEDEIIGSRDWAYWRDAFAENGITCGAVHKVEDMPSDQQGIDAGMFANFQGSTDRTIDSPLQVSGTAKAEPRLPPEVGEHSEAILTELGFAPDQLQELIDAGVVGAKS